MRSTHLKAVSSEKGSVPVRTEEYAPERHGSWFETTRIPNLIGDMERMMGEFFNRPFGWYGATPWRGLFSEFGAGGGYSPAVDIYEDGGYIWLKADLPGFDKKDINVKLVGNTLEICGEKRCEEKVDKKDYLRLERSYGKFSRTVRLPEGLDYEHVAANFAEGVLEIKIPRVEDKRAIHHVTIK
jgi:HSP20 family protein